MLEQVSEGISYSDWIEANKEKLGSLANSFDDFTGKFKLFGGLKNVWQNLKDKTGDIKDAAGNVISGVVNKNWLNSVSDTFNQYKSKFGNRYNQGITSGQDRADCSGFVFSALRNAGYNVGVGNTATMIDSPAFTNAISKGFKRVEWNGPADASKLPAGTILAYKGTGGKSGHTLILGANGTSYDYGHNSHTEYSPNLNRIYTTAWVPIA